MPLIRLCFSTAAMAVALVVAASGCSSSESAHSAGTRQTLSLTGSSTVAPLAEEIRIRFEEQHPGDYRIDVQTGGSSRGVADTRRGLADIGMVSRALKPDESDLTAHTIARDGIGIIVHANNTVRELTDEQIVGIYTGRIENWDEVGGPDAPITVVHKAEGRSTLELFLAHFHLDNAAVQPDVVIGDNQQGIKTVSGNPLAIGYVSIGAAEFEAQNGAPLKLLPMGGIEASTATVRDGTFPLSRELNLVTRGTPDGLAREFIDFARSPAVHDLIEDLSFVPLSE